VLAGAAGGIGAIFQAPRGAALFAPEVLYRETEFEYEAILPCIVSSITAYAVYTQLYNGGALFFPGPVGFSLPGELLPYALFGDRDGRMTGIVSINDIRAVLFEETIDRLIVALDVATPNVVRVHWNETLQQALDKMAAINVDELPVAREERPDEIVAMISKRDIVDYYYGRSTS